MILKHKACDPFVLSSSRDLFCSNSTFSSDYIGGQGVAFQTSWWLDSQFWPCVSGELDHLSEMRAGRIMRKCWGSHVVYSPQIYKLFYCHVSFFTADENIPAKILSYNRANRAVAILCNHQRAPPKTFEKSMMNLQSKVMWVWMVWSQNEGSHICCG